MSVFVTDATWHLSLSVMRSLAAKKIRVVGGDIHKRYYFRSMYCDKYFTYPNPETNEFIPKLQKILEKVQANILIPMSNSTVFAVSSNRELLNGIVDIPLPDHGSINIALDKYRTATVLSQNGVPTPKTWLVNEKTNLNRLFSKLEFPVILKPRKSEGSAKGVVKVDNENKLQNVVEKLLKEFKEIVVQEYIPGNSSRMVMVNALYDFDHNPVAVFTARKIREYPVNGGITTLGESTHSPELAELGIHILDSLKWVGVAEIEFKVDPRDDTPKVIEVNPRFWSYLQLPIVCGVDFPYLLYKISRGEKVEPIKKYKVGIKYIHPIKDLISVVKLLASKQTSLTETLRSYSGVRAFAYTWRDPLPLIGKLFLK